MVVTRSQRGQHLMAERIQEWWRRLHRRRRASLVVQRWFRRALSFGRCPITLRLLRRDAVWCGNEFFNAAPLRDWIMHSGDTRNPLSREPLDRDVLDRLGIGDLGDARRDRAESRSVAGVQDYLEREIIQHTHTIVDIINGGRSADTVSLVHGNLQTVSAIMMDLIQVGGEARVRRVVQTGLGIIMSQEYTLQSLPLYLIVRAYYCNMRDIMVEN